MAPGNARRRFGEILLEEGAVDPLQLTGALALQASRGQRLGEILVAQGALHPRTRARALATQLEVPLVDVEQVEVEPAALRAVPARVVERFGAFPFRVNRRRKLLQVATPDPTDKEACHALARHSGLRVELAVCDEEAVDRAIRRYYRGEVIEALPAEQGAANELEVALQLAFQTARTRDLAERAVAQVRELQTKVLEQDLALRTLVQLLDERGLLPRRELLARSAPQPSLPPPLPLRPSGPPTRPTADAPKPLPLSERWLRSLGA